MKLNQVTVPSLDLSASLAFYTKLGFELIVDAAPNYIRFLCPDGHATFSVHLVEALPTGPSPYLYFESDTLDDLVMDLKSKGIRFEQDPVDQSWLWREALLRDPDNNLLILYHAGENRIDPPWRV